MRPVLDPDAYPVEVDGGVDIVTCRGRVQLTGASVAQWVAKLSPLLDGGRTLVELTAELSAERADLVVRLVQTLQRQGVVSDAADPPAGQLDDRDLTWLVTGAGELVPALAAAAAGESGRSRVLLAADSDGLPGELANQLSDVDVVLHASTVTDWHRAVRWERRCVAEGITCGQVIVDGGEAWLSVAAGGTPVWSAVWPRLAARSGAAGKDSLEVAPGKAPVPPATATLAASQLVHAVAGPGAAGPAGHRLVRLDLKTLRDHPHPILPHPFAAAAGPATEAEFRRRIEELSDGEPVAAEEFSRRAARCADPRLGMFHFADHDWAQLPLHVSEAVVADPVGLLGRPTPRVAVVGAAFDYQQARHRAARAALACYASLVVDPRRLAVPAWPDGLLPAAAQIAGLVSEAGGGFSGPLAAVREGRVTARVWGSQLDDPGRVRLVPATDAFPVLRAGGWIAGGGAGLGAGYDWQEAVTAGLLDHCRRFALSQLSAAVAPYPQVDPADLIADPDAGRCLAILAELPGPLECYDLTSPLGVPTYACCVAGRTVAYGCGLTAADAVRRGLELVLRWHQARIHRQPAYAPAPVPELPARLRGRSAAAGAPPAVDLPMVARRLRESGRIAVAVPLDHDPELVAILPHLVRVVMLDG